ncbi:transporter substrate-binding domain-containing protein [Bacteroides sp.]|uniref:transporter substrate-binding domain-containing protein n=1 Tax=Bacteroides sp. TaxID=29523 RepID=UPI00261022C8|nr:transporter substrate-binding domain-containing protein [Bacteroides sp.]
MQAVAFRGIWAVERYYCNLCQNKTLFNYIVIFRAMYLLKMVLSACGLIISLSVFAQLNNEKLSFKDRVIVAKGDQQFAPFEFINEEGNPDGFSVELFQAVMKRLGVKYSLKLDDWAEVQNELNNKKIDLVIGMIYSKERAEKVKFGIPHCMISYNIVCRKDNDFANLEQLRGKSIIVQNKDRAHGYLLSSGLTDKIITVENIADAVKLLADGKYDAVLSFDISSFYFVRKGGYDNLLVHLTDIPPERYSIAVNTDNEDLLYLLNAAIYQMKIDGEYDKIYYKWFGVYESPKISKVVWYVSGALGICLVLFGVFIWVLRLKINQATKELKEKNNAMSQLVGDLKSENERRLEIEKNLIEAKERAEESDRLKSAFLANMSHEIRTPLNAIVGFSSIICETEFEEDRNKFQDIILKNNDLLLQLINDVLDLSRIESGTLLMNYAYFQLSDVCNQALSSVNQTMKKEEVQLYGDISFDCTLYSDRSRVVQVLINFLNNAFKFTNHGKVVLCTKLLENNQVEIAVVDTGIGIDEDKRQLVFERFTKLNVFSQGTGLGLSICKNIIDKLHGTIGVDSTVGVGSKFWIRLPISEKP